MVVILRKPELRFRPDASAGASEARDDLAHKEPSRLVCARCAFEITSDDQRKAVAGSVEHTCVNPAGVVYRFLCFAKADGCSVAGAPSTEWSWFAGYSWRVAFCARCNAHLGWLFEGDGQSFFGLIRETLVTAGGLHHQS
jgi:hypothetical protein